MNIQNKAQIKIWPYSGIFFFFWLGSNILVPYLGVFYEERGFSGDEIGLLSSLFQFMTAVASLVGGYLADRSGKTGKAIVFMTGGMILSAWFLYFSCGLLATMLAVILLSICYAPINGITDKALMEKLQNSKIPYSVVRSKGTLGAAAGIMVAAVLMKRGGFLFIIAGFAAAVLPCMVCGLHFDRTENGTYNLPRGKDYGEILKNPYFIPIYGALAAWGLAESGVGTFQALLVKEAGYPVTLISLFVVCAMAGEYVGFLALPRIQQRCSVAQVLAIAFVIQVLRIGSLSLIGILSLPIVVLFQFIGGASFGMLYSETTCIVDDFFPEKTRYTAHLLKRVMINGVGNTVGLLLLGIFFERQLIRPAYWLISTGSVLFMIYFIKGKVFLGETEKIVK